jgi:aspartate beta-hydroxylase
MGKMRSSDHCFKLPLSFDAVRLRAELGTLLRLDWPPEAPFIMETPFAAKTLTYHDGKWRGLSLRSQGGYWTRTDPGGPGLQCFSDSDLLDQVPYFREVIDTLNCDKRSVRLLLLPGGAQVATHVDPYHGFKFGQIRLHCPVVTHPGVKMYFEDHEYHWPAGELWYADFGRPHSVKNTGSDSRIHLVIDALISPELLRHFPPEFIDEQHRTGILMQQPAVPLSLPQLGTYVCEFKLPAALVQGIFETDDGSVPGELDGAVQIHGSQLAVCIAGKPLFGLVPVGDHRFTLTGWTPERLVELHPGPDGHVDTVILQFRSGKNESTIRMPARAPAHKVPA